MPFCTGQLCEHWAKTCRTPGRGQPGGRGHWRRARRPGGGSDAREAPVARAALRALGEPGGL